MGRGVEHWLVITKSMAAFQKCRGTPLQLCIFTNQITTLKSFWYTRLLLFLSSTFKTLCKEWRRDQYLLSQLPWSPCWNTLHSRMWVSATERTVSCCLPREKGIQTLLTQTWSAAKGLLGMATECLLSRVTQLFSQPEAPLLFFLSSSLLPLHPAWISPPLLHAYGWPAYCICKSHNTQLQFDPCYKTLVKGNLLCPSCCLCSAVLPSSSRVNVLQPKPLHCLL